ncbi:DNA ligase LigA-related protein [Bradyrhizobium denitrificans]
MSETLDLFADLAPAKKVEPRLDLWARQAVIASLLYYRHDHSFMSDGDFDKLCQRIADAWDDLSQVRKFMLGSPGEIRSSGFHVKVTVAAENAAYQWMVQQRVRPSVVGRINNWTFDEKHRLHWAGISS